MAVAGRDYYDVLGVSRDADEEAIRKAYYHLARDWHPDISDIPDAEARFRELVEAYSVLSRLEARLLYDRYGYRGRGNQGLEEAVGKVRGGNAYTAVELRHFEAREGTRRLVRFHGAMRCTACVGRGSLALPDRDCEHCLGTRRRQIVSNLESAKILQIEPCPACVMEPCTRCGGSGTIPVERRLRLLIPAGVEDGTQLRVRGDGNDAGAGSIPGDLLVDVRVLPPPRDPRIVRYASFLLLVVAIATLVGYVIR